MLIITICFIYVWSGFAHEAVGKTLGMRDINPVDPDKTDDIDDIVGGDVVDIKQYPYQARLFYRGVFKCGGSIISEDYVLTAAHCVGGNPGVYSVGVGGSYKDKEGYIHSVSKTYIHPKYESLDYDIAIILLSSKIELNEITIKVVQLPDSESFIKPGENIVVTGWGKTKEGGTASDFLRAVAVPVTTNVYCSKAYAKIKMRITDRMLCAGLKKGGKDSCQGDSGGPAVGEKNLVQYGIVSFGHGCARKGYPGVYTYVPRMRDWIKEITGF